MAFAGHETRSAVMHKMGAAMRRWEYDSFLGWTTKEARYRRCFFSLDYSGDVSVAAMEPITILAIICCSSIGLFLAVHSLVTVAHGDDIELGRVESSVKQLPRPGVAITKTTVVATSPAELASPVEPTIPNDANILFEERYDKWGQDAILAIYKYKGLSFDDTNFQLLIDTLRKHNTEEWKALRLLQEITQKDELTRFILRDATLSESRRRVIMREVRARGVKWTPAFHEEIEVGDIILINLLSTKLTYYRPLSTGARV
jgi:hypothetical protein